MNIRFLETAVMLAELRNFRMTAERMNITPAAVSNRIAALEQELGIRLFERDSREVAVTADGAVFIEGARGIVADYGALVARVAPATAAEGTVRIGVLPSIAMTALPALLDAVRTRFPAVRVAVTTEGSRPLQQKLARRELDIVLGFAPPDSAGLRHQHLCRFGMFWVASPGGPGLDGRLTRADLVHHPIISYEAGSPTHARTLDYLGPLADEAVMHSSNALTTTISMVAGRVGIAVLPPIVIQDALRDGRLRVLELEPPYPPLEYDVVWADPAPSPLPRMIAQLARATLAEFCANYDDSVASAR